MQGYIKRSLTEKIKQKSKSIPVVAILGPRQCGKSTLARAIVGRIKNSVYLDLERPSDIKLRSTSPTRVTPTCPPQEFFLPLGSIERRADST